MNDNLKWLQIIQQEQKQNYVLLIEELLYTLNQCSNDSKLFSLNCNDYKIFNIYDTVLQCIEHVLINEQATFYIYFNNENIISISESYPYSDIVKKIHLNFNCLQYNYYDFLKLCNLIMELKNPEKVNIFQNIPYYTTLLKLSQKIPFYTHGYCSCLLTNNYNLYRDLLFQEQIFKLIQYILNQLNKGIKDLIGTEDIKIEGKFKLEEITKKKEELKNTN